MKTSLTIQIAVSETSKVEISIQEKNGAFMVNVKKLMDFFGYSSSIDVLTLPHIRSYIESLEHAPICLFIKDGEGFWLRDKLALYFSSWNNSETFNSMQDALEQFNRFYHESYLNSKKQ